MKSDLSKFANNNCFVFNADFTNTGPIKTGNLALIIPAVPLTNGSLPAKGLMVTVTSETPNSWTFTSDPNRHWLNGTVTFMASDVPGGSVSFVVTVNANYTSRLASLLGPAIERGENSTWNNLLDNVQGFCKGVK